MTLLDRCKVHPSPCNVKKVIVCPNIHSGLHFVLVKPVTPHISQPYHGFLETGWTNVEFWLLSQNSHLCCWATHALYLSDLFMLKFINAQKYSVGWWKENADCLWVSADIIIALCTILLDKHVHVCCAIWTCNRGFLETSLVYILICVCI